MIRDFLTNLNNPAVFSLDIGITILCLIAWLKFREPILIVGFGIYLVSTIVWHTYH